MSDEHDDEHVPPEEEGLRVRPGAAVGADPNDIREVLIAQCVCGNETWQVFELSNGSLHLGCTACHRSFCSDGRCGE